MLQAIGNESDKRLDSRDCVSRNRWWRIAEDSDRNRRPLRIFMIKRLLMMRVRVRADRRMNAGEREIWRSTARQQDTQGRNTHDGGTELNRAAIAFPEGPDKRHVHPTSYSKMLLLSGPAGK